MDLGDIFDSTPLLKDLHKIILGFCGIFWGVEIGIRVFEKR